MEENIRPITVGILDDIKEVQPYISTILFSKKDIIVLQGETDSEKAESYIQNNAMDLLILDLSFLYWEGRELDCQKFSQFLF